ncbi:MAG TPA: helix-turn-helix domain-containing protein [Chloroflexota bacterium]|nr:helix-turn-helix domain-containing protein [Chloroflexota bacterium]
MTRGVPHSPEFRAQVVAAVLAGTGISQAARDFGVDKATVSEWCARAHVPTIPTIKTETDTDLLMRYFRAALRTLIAQTEVFGDEQYCRAQEADKLAIAHGVLADKLVGVAATAQALGLIGPPQQLALAGPADAAPSAADDDH